MMLERDSVSGRYIMRIDASLYKESDCARFIKYKLIDGLVSNGTGLKNPVTEYGTAFHKGLQARAQGATLERQLELVTGHFGQPSIVCGDREWRNMGHLVATYVAYDSTYKVFDPLKVITKNGVALVEQRFMYPFYKTELVEVLLCGTIDMIAEFYGETVIVDHKTTSAWNIREYLAEYDLSPQLMIYKWVYDQLNGTAVGAVINGIFLGSKTPAKFERSDVIRFSERQVENCLASLMAMVKRTVSEFEQQLVEPKPTLFLPNYCQCSKRFGEKISVCQFKLACQQQTVEDEQCVIDSQFERATYNPMLWQE